MNSMDALCKICGAPFQWSALEPMVCGTCRAKVRMIGLSEEDDHFHAGTCALPREKLTTTVVIQGLIVLPVTQKFGYFFREYECPSCHEWISVRFDSDEH